MASPGGTVVLVILRWLVHVCLNLHGGSFWASWAHCCFWSEMTELPNAATSLQGRQLRLVATWGKIEGTLQCFGSCSKLCLLEIGKKWLRALLCWYTTYEYYIVDPFCFKSVTSVNKILCGLAGYRFRTTKLLKILKNKLYIYLVCGVVTF